MWDSVLQYLCLSKDRPPEIVRTGPLARSQSVYRCAKCTEKFKDPRAHRQHSETCCNEKLDFSTSLSSFRDSPYLTKQQSDNQLSGKLLEADTSIYCDSVITALDEKSNTILTKTSLRLSKNEKKTIDDLTISLKEKAIYPRALAEHKFLNRYAKNGTDIAYVISQEYLNSYLKYLKTRRVPLPSAIDNKGYSSTDKYEEKENKKVFTTVNEIVWYFLIKMYGGGPEIISYKDSSAFFSDGLEIISNYSNKTSNNTSVILHKDHNTSRNCDAYNNSHERFSVIVPYNMDIDAECKVRGLRNDGYYCYMNACLQVILGVQRLVQYLITEQYKQSLKHPKSKYWKAMAETIALINTDASGSISDISKRIGSVSIPTSLRQLVANRFTPEDQHDVHEFLIFVLSGMQDEVNISRPKGSLNFTDSETAWKSYHNYCISMVDKIFAGQFASRVVCNKCKSISTTYEPFLGLSLPVIPNSTRTLEECLALFMTKEEIKVGYVCEKCKKQHPATKQLALSRLPKVLFVHFKRFQMYPKKMKINNEVSFPIDKWILKGEGQVNEYVYNLIGVVCHVGDVDSGHYYAFTKRSGEWFYCNDERVGRATEEQVMKSEAYLLFYESQI